MPTMKPAACKTRYETANVWKPGSGNRPGSLGSNSLPHHKITGSSSRERRLQRDHAENTQGPFSLRVKRWRSTSLVLKVFKIVDKVQFGRTVSKSGCIPLPRVL